MSWIDCVIAAAHIPIKIIHRLEQNAAIVGIEDETTNGII